MAGAAEASGNGDQNEYGDWRDAVEHEIKWQKQLGNFSAPPDDPFAADELIAAQASAELASTSQFDIPDPRELYAGSRAGEIASAEYPVPGPLDLRAWLTRIGLGYLGGDWTRHLVALATGYEGDKDVAMRIALGEGSNTPPLYIETLERRAAAWQKAVVKRQGRVGETTDAADDRALAVAQALGLTSTLMSDGGEQLVIAILRVQVPKLESRPLGDVILGLSDALWSSMSAEIQALIRLTPSLRHWMTDAMNIYGLERIKLGAGELYETWLAKREEILLRQLSDSDNALAQELMEQETRDFRGAVVATMLQSLLERHFKDDLEPEEALTEHELELAVVLMKEAPLGSEPCEHCDDKNITGSPHCRVHTLAKFLWRVINSPDGAPTEDTPPTEEIVLFDSAVSDTLKIKGVPGEPGEPDYTSKIAQRLDLAARARELKQLLSSSRLDNRDLVWYAYLLLFAEVGDAECARPTCHSQVVKLVVDGEEVKMEECAADLIGRGFFGDEKLDMNKWTKRQEPFRAA